MIKDKKQVKNLKTYEDSEEDITNILWDLKELITQVDTSLKQSSELSEEFERIKLNTSTLYGRLIKYEGLIQGKFIPIIQLNEIHVRNLKGVMNNLVIGLKRLHELIND